MSTEWLVAKYMPDLKRREPRNVGVMLRVGHRTLSRFAGERAGGGIDGRFLRGRVADVDTYRAWVNFWRHAVEDAGSLREVMQPTGDENYAVEYGGERLLGSDAREAEDMLDYLYATLVEELPEKEALSVAQLSENVLGRLDIADKVERGYRLNIPHERFTDRVRFDYRYVNRRPHLMQQVSLTLSDERSWDVAHAAAWSFEKAHGAEVDTSLIALVKQRQADDDLERQLLLLEEQAAVVDVGETERATENLRELLQLGTGQAI
jgi:hypothetical protein